MELRRLSTRVVYENRWMRVREDQVRRPDGSDGVYGVVEKPDFALIVPLADDGGLWVVEQFRYPVGERFCEFPQGSWKAGRTPTPSCWQVLSSERRPACRPAHCGDSDTSMRPTASRTRDSTSGWPPACGKGQPTARPRSRACGHASSTAASGTP
jgi:hypothetical protein